MTLYIAGPMSGLTERNYPTFVNVGTQLRVLGGYRVLNPVDAENFNPTPGSPQPWDWYMRHALRMITDADGVALLDGWWRSTGATLEVHVARALGMPCEPWRWWLKGKGGQ